MTIDLKEFVEIPRFPFYLINRDGTIVTNRFGRVKALKVQTRWYSFSVHGVYLALTVDEILDYVFCGAPLCNRALAHLERAEQNARRKQEALQARPTAPKEPNLGWLDLSQFTAIPRFPGYSIRFHDGVVISYWKHRGYRLVNHHNHNWYSLTVNGVPVFVRGDVLYNYVFSGSSLDVKVLDRLDCAEKSVQMRKARYPRKKKAEKKNKEKVVSVAFDFNLEKCIQNLHLPTVEISDIVRNELIGMLCAQK